MQRRNVGPVTDATPQDSAIRVIREIRGPTSALSPALRVDPSLMEAVARQRCFHHASREAAARCPECGHFFCRECITEHDDRIVCASCLKKLALAESRPEGRRWNLWPASQIAGGMLFAWVLFYLCGLGLLAIPDEFHDAKIWQDKVMDFFQMQNVPP